MCRFQFLFLAVGILAVLCGVHQVEGLDIFLTNITIFADHEAPMPFVSNDPEVYLSCEDDLPNLELSEVNDLDNRYSFIPGLNATVVEPGECVTCTLRESDATDLLPDDDFGSWTMCQEDFEETGSLTVEEPDEFIIVFACPDCQDPVVEVITSLPPATSEPVDVNVPPATSEPVEVNIPPAMEPAPEEDQEESFDDGMGTYYTISEGNSFSVPEGSDNGDVVLQSKPPREVAIENNHDGSGGISVTTVLSLCLVFLTVGIAAGVFLFWRFSGKVRKQREAFEVVQMANAGLKIKTSID